MRSFIHGGSSLDQHRTWWWSSRDNSLGKMQALDRSMKSLPSGYSCPSLQTRIPSRRLSLSLSLSFSLSLPLVVRLSPPLHERNPAIPRGADQDPRWRSRCHLDETLLRIVPVGVRQEGDRARWLEPMVSAELTAASAHRSKVHPTTTTTVATKLLLLLLLLILLLHRYSYSATFPTLLPVRAIRAGSLCLFPRSRSTRFALRLDVYPSLPWVFLSLRPVGIRSHTLIPPFSPSLLSLHSLSARRA